MLRFGLRLLFCALCVSAPLHASASWQVSLDGRDVTSAASPIIGGDGPSLDIAALGPALGIRAQVSGQALLVVDGKGYEWSARSGAYLLASASKTISLSRPLRILGGAAYLPVTAVAELAGISVRIDKVNRVVEFTSPGVKSISEAAGWQPFTDVDVGFGATLGAQSGGYRPSGVRLTLNDSEQGRALEAGDLFSDISGIARGIRYSWRARGDRWSGLSFYAPGLPEGARQPLLAYRDEFKLGRSVWLGGEIASNGAAYSKIRIETGHLSLFAYGRAPSGGLPASAGAYIAHELPGGLSVYGSFSRSHRVVERSTAESLGIRIPTRRGVDLTLERNWFGTGTTASVMNSAALAVPLGPLRTSIRFNQAAAGSILIPGAGQASAGQLNRQLAFSAAFLGSRRMNLDYQANLNWHAAGRSAATEQVVGGFRLTARTELQAISAFPNLLDASRLEFRLNHSLRSDLGISLGYGAPVGYAPAGAKAPARQFMLTLRPQWGVATPARGGHISGHVADQTGRPAPGVEVRVNAYRAVADSKGFYHIENLPSGTYNITLGANTIPADYKSAEAPRTLVVGPGTSAKMEFRVIPLNSVSGRVVYDRGDETQSGQAEGVPNVVLHLGSAATSTGPDGSFAFYNLEPGPHSIRLDTERLATGLALASPEEATATLQPDGSSSGVFFILPRTGQ